MSNRSLQALYYNVSVIGLSGVEDVRGAVGVGKSCLCNRFVRPDEDTYFSEHAYVLSQSDFGGEVVNNVQWLYWGETTRQNPDTEQTCIFRVVEQTEFIDDTAFKSLSCGATESYPKRCLNLKLKSAKKMVYICKDQLGLEGDYPKNYLPDGKICIDGFIYAFDVSNAHSIGNQLDFMREVLISMPKVQKRRPFVIATTKNDIASEAVKLELERFLGRRDMRNIVNNVSIVETSAAEGVNVDTAFMVLASMIEKSKTKPRIQSYSDAGRLRTEEMDRLRNNLNETLLMSVTSHRTDWIEWSHRHDHMLQEYFSVLGNKVVKQVFESHVSDMRTQFIDLQKNRYLHQLPSALDDLLSTSETVNDCTISDIINRILMHERFDHWFVHSSKDWEHADSVERGEMKIPSGLLFSGDARILLMNHSHKLEEADTINERRKAFLSLLRKQKSVKAGKKLSDVAVFLDGDDCYDGLPMSDRMEIFSKYQQELTEKSKSEFHELLLERADLFFKLALPLYHVNGETHSRQNMTQFPALTMDELLMRQLCHSMQNAAQYRNLDCLSNERQKMIFNHLAHFRAMASAPSALFPVSPGSRPSYLCAAPAFECPASPCVQSRLVDYLSGLASRISPSTKSYPLYVIGQAPWSSGVAALLKEKVTPFPNTSFEFELHTPDLVVRPEIIVQDCSPRRSLSFPSNSLILMVYRDAQSIALLEQMVIQLGENGEKYGDKKWRNQQLACVVFHLCDSSAIPSEEIRVLTLRGSQLGCQVNGVFADMQLLPGTRFRQQRSHMPSESLRTNAASTETFQLWHYLDNALNRSLLAQPKITVIMAFMCSDLYPIDLVMKSIVNEQTRFVPWKQRLYIGNGQEVVLSSYFQLLQLMTGPLPAQVHGLILVFWTARKASLTSMQAVCTHCPVHWPKLVIGIGVDGREEYLQGGQDLAHDMEAPFAHIQPEQTDYRQQFETFLKECSDAKVVTEDRNRQLMGAPARRPANHPSTLPPPPVSSSASRQGYPVQRRKSSAGSHVSNSQSASLTGARKSWHSSNSGHEDGLIYSVPDARAAGSGGQAQRDFLYENQDSKKSCRDIGETVASRSRQDEDEYSCPYEDLPESSSLRMPSGSNEISRDMYPPLSQLDSNSLDMIYSEPLDIHAFGSPRHDQEISCHTSNAPVSGEATTGGGSSLPMSVHETTRAQPFSDGENEYAEVEGFNQGHIQLIRSLHLNPARLSPPPPPPFPRTTSEADPWERRYIPPVVRHISPEYDEPACDSETSLPTPVDNCVVAIAGYSSLDECEESERHTQRFANLSRFTSERRSHKESKKKGKSDLTSSKSFGGGDRVESKKSRSSSAQGGTACHNPAGSWALSSSGNTSKWRRAFRSGSSGNTVSSTTSPTRDAQKNQDTSPKIQAPPPPVDPYILTCTEYIDRHGLRQQGIYRQPGNRNVAEAIRQRSKDGYFLDWLSGADVTAYDVATALKLHLSSLPEPVMPLDIRLLREISALPNFDMRIDRLRTAVLSLPLANQRLLHHILYHLHKVTDYSDVNDMNASNLAICWTPTLAIPHNADVAVLLALVPIQNLVATLIEHFDHIFQAVT